MRVPIYLNDPEMGTVLVWPPPVPVTVTVYGVVPPPPPPPLLLLPHAPRNRRAAKSRHPNNIPRTLRSVETTEPNPIPTKANAGIGSHSAQIGRALCSEAVEDTLMVTVEVLAVDVRDAGFGVQVIPVGPEQVRATLVLVEKPGSNCMVTVEVAEAPLATGLGEGVVAVSEKLGTTLARKASLGAPPKLACTGDFVGRLLEAVTPVM